MAQMWSALDPVTEAEGVPEDREPDEYAVGLAHEEGEDQAQRGGRDDPDEDEGRAPLLRRVEYVGVGLGPNTHCHRRGLPRGTYGGTYAGGHITVMSSLQKVTLSPGSNGSIDRVAHGGPSNGSAGSISRAGGTTPGRTWARPDSNRRSSLCESDVVTAGPRARRPGRAPPPFKQCYRGSASTSGRTRLAVTVRMRPLASERLPASSSPKWVTK